MNDGNPRYVEPRSNPRAAGGSRLFQFSLASVFVAVTAMALVLSTFFSVGRLLGMSNVEVLALGLKPFFFGLPTLLVWIVGLGMAIRRLKRNRAAAILTLIALGGLVLTSFVLQVVEMALMRSLPIVYSLTQIPIPWALTSSEVLWGIFNAAWWILILVAIFTNRPPDTPESERADPGTNPFGLTSVLAIVTLMALIMSTYFGVGRLLGMSNMGVLWVRFTSLVFYLPTLLVWIVGLRMAIWRLKRNRVPAIRTMFALGGLILTWFVLEVVDMALIRLLPIAYPGWEITWPFDLTQVLHALLDASWWILILLAIVAQRSPDAPATEMADPGGHAGRVA
jgi:hypothetical protein